ncbi:alpha/beta hydrolase [Streptomyces tendae]|uniref:alpha/beta fold hydrolase n=1 Tax=Streptomyces tendae TaxID=1932 RepID=UPI0033C98470
MARVRHRYEVVDGHKIFYREAGRVDAPAVVLLHGFPSSSFMFRELIPRLADSYRVIAPDFLGFGFSDAPSVERFNYTFDALTDLTEELLIGLNIARYAIYVQNYGAPVGWRLALRHPESVTAIISQGGNAYDVGFVDTFWDTVRAYEREQNSWTEAAARQSLSLELIKWLYINGVEDESVVSPDAWNHDFALVSRPGNDLVQLKLFCEYTSNSLLYPRLHEYFRSERPPLLAVWGRDDEVFCPAGAQAFAGDLPNAEIHLLEGGHFLLESALDSVAPLVRKFLARHARL